MKKLAIEVISEFIKYIIVGTISFIADYKTLVFLHEVAFPYAHSSLFISSIIGFLVGLLVNYNLSIRYVFKGETSKNMRRSIKDKGLFLLIGLIGLLLNEIGFYFGVFLNGLNYRFVKIVIAGIVLIWNYLARKLLIFT